MRLKTANEFTENIIMGIFFAGAITITAPYFVATAIPGIINFLIRNKQEKRSFCNTFSKLRKQGLIKIRNNNGQIYISLTAEGKRKAGKYQIDNLKIKKLKKWDKKWRILIFDIKNEQKIKREALRGKIKELHLFQLQKSVWIYPYDFTKEMGILRSFFGLTKDEMQIITASNIENDGMAKKFFGLK
jgi:DNA-binding transcriptional regulator PaaX